jgi:serine/threonine protein kinase
MTAALVRYDMLGLLGEGGHAVVYRVFDHSLGRLVALKTLLPQSLGDADLRARFEYEARTLALLTHPNLVRVLENACHESPPYFTMELLEGSTLEQTIAPGYALPIDAVLRLIAPLAAALDYIHACGFVHRDVKPANVMVEPSGRVVLMDLGIARRTDTAGPTRAGSTIGTPLYMSPEQARGEAAGPAADIYALGVITYQLLAGRPPFEGDTVTVLHGHLTAEPPSLRSLRPDLPETVQAAMVAVQAKNPAHRFASAGAFVAALALQQERASSPQPQIQRVGDIPPVALIVLGLCLVALVVSIAAGLSGTIYLPSSIVLFRR